MDTTPIVARLSVIANAVNGLRALQKATFEEFSQDATLHAAAERHFQVAIQAALDIGSILLAEEPTGNLDSATGEESMRLFERLHEEGNTIILVTHERDIADHAHRTIHIRDGKIESDEARKKA